jgi:N-acetylglucosaminyldiphosphoundecaprenol N-acetyl-beta-D-mannosaminyltransferase
MADFEFVLENVVAQRADIVWVGLGTPKQDLVVAHLAERAAASGIDATFVAIGAAFDFIAGTKRQAPPWMQRHGLEWLHRLTVEPRRLWKRYLVGNSRFIAGVIRDRPVVLTDVAAANGASVQGAPANDDA